MNRNRISRVLAAMQCAGVRQMIVSDSTMIYYLTGIRIWPGERLLALVLRDDGRHSMMVNTLFPVEKDPDIHFVSYCDTDDYISMLNELLYADQTVAVDKEWPAKFLLALMACDTCPAAGTKDQRCISHTDISSGSMRDNRKREYINSSSIIDNVRIIKDKEEQQKMIASSAACDRVMERLIPLCAKDLDERALTAEAKRLFREEGFEGLSFTPITSYGRNGADPHHGADGTFGKPGDCVVLDIGGVMDGYCSDMTRTVFLGEVSDRAREIYEIVKEANRRGIAAAKPGNRMCDVDLAARNYIEEKGFGPYFTHRTGHSIGFEDHEFGDVSCVNEAIIRPGQCFSVEPGIYIADENIGVRIEDLVLITEDGCQVLNSYPKDLICLPIK